MSITLAKHFDPDLLTVASPLTRIPYISRAQIEELARASRPAIFTGALEEWPARRKWRPEYFRDRWGTHAVDAYETTWSGNSPYASSEKENSAQKSVTDFLDRATRDTDYALYAHQIDAAEIFPGSLDDLGYAGMIDFLRIGPRFHPNVWMGTPGTRSGLHFDDAENLISMFYGIKAFMLVDPCSPRLLYPSRYCPSKSRIDPMRVDWSTFSRLQTAKIYIDVLQPGEMLFLPRKWWHYLASLTLTINATCWFFWEGIDYPESRSLFRPYVSYLFRCGPSYPLRFVYDFLWHGFLQRPYPMRALSPPPMGVQVWERLRNARKLRADH